VSSIEGERIRGERKEYRVYWKGWAEYTWEPIEHLENCQETLEEYYRSKAVDSDESDEDAEMKQIRKSLAEKERITMEEAEESQDKREEEAQLNKVKVKKLQGAANALNKSGLIKSNKIRSAQTLKTGSKSARASGLATVQRNAGKEATNNDRNAAGEKSTISSAATVAHSKSFAAPTVIDQTIVAHTYQILLTEQHNFARVLLLHQLFLTPINPSDAAEKEFNNLFLRRFMAGSNTHGGLHLLANYIEEGLALWSKDISGEGLLQATLLALNSLFAAHRYDYSRRLAKLVELVLSSNRNKNSAEMAAEVAANRDKNFILDEMIISTHPLELAKMLVNKWKEPAPTILLTATKSYNPLGRDVTTQQRPQLAPTAVSKPKPVKNSILLKIKDDLACEFKRMRSSAENEERRYSYSPAVNATAQSLLSNNIKKAAEPAKLQRSESNNRGNAPRGRKEIQSMGMENREEIGVVEFGLINAAKHDAHSYPASWGYSPFTLMGHSAKCPLHSRNKSSLASSSNHANAEKSVRFAEVADGLALEGIIYFQRKEPLDNPIPLRSSQGHSISPSPPSVDNSAMLVDSSVFADNSAVKSFRASVGRARKQRKAANSTSNPPEPQQKQDKLRDKV
jgi:hypothetical protein